MNKLDQLVKELNKDGHIIKLASNLSKAPKIRT